MWDGHWGYADSLRLSSVEVEEVKKEWVEPPSGLVLIRSGKVREKKVVKVTKKIMVEGEEYSKVVDEVSYGEWKDGEEEKISVSIYRHEVVIMGV